MAAAAAQQQPGSDSVEMRERPRIPPKPANLRSPLNSAAAEPSAAAPLHSAGEASSPVGGALALSQQPQPQQQQQQPQQSIAPQAAPAPLPKSYSEGPATMSASASAAAAKQAARKRTVDDFEFGRTLGEGSYSTVVEATERATGRVFAAKILDKRHIIKEKKIKYVNIERDILQALHHPYIVRLHYAFQDSQSLYFVIDMAANGELLTWIRKLGGLAEDVARFYLAEIILAVEYMHKERTLHRDLKPENILLGADMHILVTDFGTAKMFGKDDSEQRANSFVGTAEYVSPELLTDKSADRNSDLWAIGCIAYQLLTGRPPFKGLNEYQTFQKILKLDYSFPANMAPMARDLVERILVLDPERRLGAVQRGGFGELKRHAFFDGFDWQSLPLRTPPKMAAGNLQQESSRAPSAPPAIPPKPPMLRNSATASMADDTDNNYYETGRSSSDGFDTEKTSDSFPTSPSASTDPLASGNSAAGVAHNLHSYRINPPISPVQTPWVLGAKPGSAAGRHVYCGVREFSSDEGIVEMPQWLAAEAQAEDGDALMVEYVPLEKAQFAQLQVLETASGVLESVDVRSVLESHMRRNMTALFLGETLKVRVGGHSECVLFSVSALEPAGAVDVVDTDLSVDIVQKNGAQMSQGRVEDGNESNELVIGSPKRIVVSGEEDVPVAGFTSECQATLVAKPSSTLPEATNSLMDVAESNGVDEQLAPGMVLCGNCGSQVPEQRIDMHRMVCERNNIKCGHCLRIFKRNSEELLRHWHCPQCSVSGDIDDEAKHIAYFHTPQSCSCSLADSSGSHVLFESLAALAEHRRTECPERLIECRYCHTYEQQGAQSDSARDRMEGLRAHEAYCGSRSIKCAKCQAYVAIRQVPVHMRLHQERDRERRANMQRCANKECLRERSTAVGEANPLGLCKACFGQLYAGGYDPGNVKLLKRLTRVLHSQMTQGCGRSKCNNSQCATGGLAGSALSQTAAAARIVPVLKAYTPITQAMFDVQRPGIDYDTIDLHLCI
ncbi:3-phosphoinositide dependent protein kinase-1 [Coemansia sp. Benny D115]|nr:3-phosphoinositide dependent protein kinase-1 [Coemansia sp. Benny D115]